jgi:DNA-binding MarR family transcriptional regulator
VSDEHGASRSELQPLEIKILRIIQSKPQTEKRISKELGIDRSVLYTVITDLMFKNCLEISRRRRMYFFRREFCSITMDGIAALESAKTPFQAFVEILQKKALETIDSLAEDSTALKAVVSSAKTLYRFAKVVV